MITLPDEFDMPASKISRRTAEFGYAFIERLQPELTGIDAAQAIGKLETRNSYDNLTQLVPKPTAASTANTYCAKPMKILKLGWPL